MTFAEDSKSPGELPNLPDVAGLSGIDPAQPSASAQPSFRPRDHHDAPVIESAPPPLRPVRVEVAQPAIVPARDPYLGRTFGGYELVAKVGQGGMGLVYKGLQVSLDRTVAVKILNRSLSDNAEFIKRFEREAKSIARINHPNIVAVYDFGVDDGLWYMVCEFIEGQSFSKSIADKLMLTVDELIPIMVQCLAGLAHVGAQGIVHRDIKPDNILITKEGIAKIADFGLAKDVSNNDATDLTSVGMAMGTPAYMSPEQCMGRKLDGRSDVYALGVTAYLALTGEKPFVGQSSFEIMTKQREFTPPPPMQLNPNIAKDASDLVMHMLAKNASERFRDAEDCRGQWVEIGQRLGIFTGDPTLKVADRANKSQRLGSVPQSSHAPMPAPLTSLQSLPPPVQPLAQQPLSLDPALKRRSGEFLMPPPLSSQMPAAAEESGKPGSDRQHRPGTEKREQRSSTASGEAMTCTRCGFLNRADNKLCSRCGHELREGDSGSAKDQEAEASRLMDNNDFKGAAALYSRLADKEDDRRARAILRSKEREARTLEHQQQVKELEDRTHNLLNRGELKAGIQVLERGLAHVRDAGASSTGAETRLMEQITHLRTALRRRRQLRIAAVVSVVLVLLIGAIALKVGLTNATTDHATPPPSVAPTVLPASGQPAQPAPKTIDNNKTDAPTMLEHKEHGWMMVPAGEVSCVVA